MSAVASHRSMLRHTRFVARQTTRRHASTTEAAKDTAANTAAKTKETASNVQTKASQGLSRVTTSAGSGLTRASQGISKAVGRIGGRTGRLISFVESLIPPTIYYSKVGLELSKMVFKGQKMSPPDLATFQRYTQPIINAIRNPAGLLNKTTDTASSMSPEALLNRVRNMSTQQMVAAGVVGAEVLGFFTIGEMIGRMKLVGYRGGVAPHGEETPH